MFEWFTDNILGINPTPPPATTISVPTTNAPDNSQEFTPTNNLNIDTEALGKGLSDIAQANLILGSYQIQAEQEKVKMEMATQAAIVENENQRYKYMGQIALILGAGFLLFRGRK